MAFRSNFAQFLARDSLALCRAKNSAKPPKRCPLQPEGGRWTGVDPPTRLPVQPWWPPSPGGAQDPRVPGPWRQWLEFFPEHGGLGVRARRPIPAGRYLAALRDYSPADGQPGPRLRCAVFGGGGRGRTRVLHVFLIRHWQHYISYQRPNSIFQSTPIFFL